MCVYTKDFTGEHQSFCLSTLCRKFLNTCLPLSLTNSMFMFKFQIRLQSGVYCGHHCLLRTRVCICCSVHSIVKPKAHLCLYLFCVRVFQTCPHKLEVTSFSFFYFSNIVYFWSRGSEFISTLEHNPTPCHTAGCSG